MRPSRALWVPFELGRPFGVPDDPSFQRRVLYAALRLLERQDGPVILEDFPDDAPVIQTGAAVGIDDNLVCPWRPPKAKIPPKTEPREVLRAEMAQLAPWYEIAFQARNRTTVGLSGLEIGEVTEFLFDILEGNLHNLKDDTFSLGQLLRFATEDLRSWYLEAAGARPGIVTSSTDLADWFWGETEAGMLVLNLCKTCASSRDESVASAARRSLVPMAQRSRLNSLRN